MQQNPISTYLRFAGIALGAILFIFMLYRASNMAQNPIYTKGKPSLQWLSASSPKQPFETLNASSSAVAAAVEGAVSPQTTANATSAPDNSEINSHTHRQSAPVAEKQVPKAVQVSESAGKALGKAKLTD